MNHLSNQKSQLAKLMATENITVQHRNAQTASFNVKDRVLTLPVFVDGLSVDVYDLMTSHEVGHALYTPADGWHDSASSKGAAFKGYLNIVEDARIERKMKTKFPGLVSAYRTGYKELLERDFFGLRNINMDRMAFIDRINLHFKLGTLLRQTFNEEEMVWVNRIANTETWEDVVQICEELYAAELEKAEEEIEQNIPAPGEESDEDGESLFSQSSDGDEEADDYEEDSSADGGDDGEEEESDDDTSGNWDDEEDDEVEEDAEDRITSLTDANYRSNENKLVKNDDREYHYYKFADIDYRKGSKMVVSNKDVVSIWKDHFATYSTSSLEIDEKMKIWRSENQSVVNYMVKEFEMRKKASEFKRATTAKSGELDMGKIFSYKFNEDLFKKVTTVTGGKNHGFVMYVDWSGSMAENMSATIDQLLNLVMFCRKTKIPFEAYSFTDRGPSNGMKNILEGMTEENVLFPGTSAKLYQLITSTSSLSDFNTSLKGLFLVRDSLSNGRYYRHQLPDGFDLGSTPLNDTLLVAPYIISEFRKKTKAEVVNFVVLTDGESDGAEAVKMVEGYGAHTNYVRGGSRYVQTMITDSVSKKTVEVSRNEDTTKFLLTAIQARTGANMIGFFVMTNKPRELRSQAIRYGIFDDNIVKKIREAKFLEINNAGYDSYFLIPGGKELDTTDNGLDVGSSASKNQIAKAFLKNTKGKTMNRVLLNRVMEVVA